MTNTRHGRQKVNSSYVYGNTAREIDIKTALEEEPSYAPLKEHKNGNVKAKRMNFSFAYVLFLTAAIAVTGYSLVSYLRLQSDITNLVDNISSYETKLNNLTLANDDEYSKMINAVDYDEIRRVAIEELGMVYASDDQIISYSRENSDYVRQLNDLTE